MPEAAASARHSPPANDLAGVTGRVLALVALGSLVATLLALIARLWWGFELFSHFRLQYLAAELVLLIVFALRRKGNWAALLAVGAGVNALVLAPYALPTSASASASASARSVPLSVLVANVWGDNHDATRLAAMIERERADLVLLVELTPEMAAGLEGVHGRYPHRALAPEHGNFGIGLYSRYPLAAVEHGMTGPNRALDARIETPAGSLTLLGVHLLAPVSAAHTARRNDELAELAERAAAGPDGALLVCGDFNVSPYSPAYRGFVTASGLDDVRRGRGLGVSWPTGLPLLGIPIDHCFAGGPVATTRVTRLADIGSDHYPQRFDFLLDPSQ